MDEMTKITGRIAAPILGVTEKTVSIWMKTQEFPYTVGAVENLIDLQIEKHAAAHFNALAATRRMTEFYDSQEAC